MKSFFEEFSNIEPNQGGYIIYRQDGTFEYKEEHVEDIFIIDKDILEGLLFEYCNEKVLQFSNTSDNKEVYAFVLYLDTTYGDVIIYLNTHEALNEEINTKECCDEDKEWMKYYGIGDYKYMIQEELPELLNQIMTLYLRIHDGQGFPKFDYDVAVVNDIFENKLINIGENVVNRLKPFSSINKSKDFIGFVADHDEEYFLNTVDEEFYNKYVKLSYV